MRNTCIVNATLFKCVCPCAFLLTVVPINADCQVYKFPRSLEDSSDDSCKEIPSHISVQQLKDNQELSVAGAKVRIVHTPGHTTDHVVLTMDDGTLFSGDCILGE